MAKILIVDDDKAARKLMVTLLSHFSHLVFEAVDGKDGLREAKLRIPDLIISDILMPTMNGFEFVSTLRKDPLLEHVPVIFHSATFLQKEAHALGMACGVSYFILKPCEPETALTIVHEALGLAKAEQNVPPSPEDSASAIPVLVDAVYERGKQLDAASSLLASLLELGMDLARADGLDVILEVSGNASRKIIGANYCGIGILAGNGLALRSFALFGGSPEVASGLAHAEFSGRIFNEIVSERRTCRTFNSSVEPAGLDLPMDHPEVRSFLGAPLKVGNVVHGWLYVANKLGSEEFTQGDAGTLAALTAHAALAVENAERFQTLQKEITERRSAEDRFRVLVETAPTGIVIADEKGRIAEVNAQALRMFGYERDELLNMPIETLLPERKRKTHYVTRTEYMKGPHARPMGVGIELFARRKDGSEFPVEISLGPLVTKEGVLVSSTIVDITERKKMEEHRRLSQRMEAIGQLAGGVAHDFNNLLGVIVGCSEMVLGELPPYHPAAKKIEMVQKAGACAADLTRQLLAFSRQQMLQPRVLDLKEIVKRMQTLLQRLLGENIQINVSVNPALGLVKADPGQIEQVLMNLAVNARDAMPKGGSLTIEACNIELDDTYRQEHAPVIPGPYVMLAMADSGTGMDSATQARIFDPFFTTKELGKGTGLGLATVYGIVKQSKGYIWVYSELNKGTVFKVYLPRLEPNAQPAEHKVTEETVFRGCETILIAEDSESLREIAREYLQSVGYTVLEAATGAEALQKARDYGNSIHLLLTDIVMPAMSGPELARKILSLRPGIKVIFTSGYTDDTIAREGVLDPSVAFIQKPFRPKALARKIQEVLARSQPAEALEQNARGRQ